MKISTRLLSISAILSAMVSSLFAQPNIPHNPRDGEHLHPGMAGSNSLILSVNDTTKTVLIDPQAVSFDNSRDASCYVDGDSISYVQFATKHRFLLKGDTLSYMGYENRSTDFRLDNPVKVAIFPLKDSTSVIDDWNGHVFHYGSMILKKVHGISKTSVQEGWTMTDGTDTINNAARLIWTLDMAYTDHDSISPEMPDSVVSDIISEMRVDVKTMMSEHLLTERTLWFVESARYPVMTDSRTSRVIGTPSSMRLDSLPLSALAIYYPASWQYSDTGEGITDERVWENEGSHSVSYSENDLLTVGEPDTDGTTVNITLSSSANGTQTTVTLYSDSGVRLSDPIIVSVDTLPQTFTLPIPIGWSGVVVLHIESGREKHTRKVIL